MGYDIAQFNIKFALGIVQARLDCRRTFKTEELSKVLHDMLGFEIADERLEDILASRFGNQVRRSNGGGSVWEFEPWTPSEPEDVQRR